MKENIEHFLLAEDLADLKSSQAHLLSGRPRKQGVMALRKLCHWAGGEASRLGSGELDPYPL